MPLTYLSIDIEATGLDSDYCQVLEVAAVLEDWKSPVEELKGWRTIVKHHRIQGEAIGLAMNADLLWMIGAPEKFPNERFLWPGEVMPAMREWIVEQGIDPMHVNTSGKNFSGCDRQFLQKLDPKNKSVKFRHRSLDPAAFFLGPDDNVIPATDECMKRAGVIPEIVQHRADPDARQVIRLNRAYYCPLWGISI